MEKAYVETVRLLLEVAPHVFRTPRFVMKGGTALNLFVRNMPRLSVDIDVVYSDHQQDRREAMEEIARGLGDIKNRLEGIGIEAKFVRTKAGDEVKLLARRAKIEVKVELNSVFRGTLLPIETRDLTVTARELFTTNLSLPVLAEEELYGSKLVAALDRQHPRDWFDVRGLYQNSGLTPEITECFVCYLAGHNRPIHEVLFSRDLDLAAALENEFQGMTVESVSVNELNETRTQLRHDLIAGLSEKHRKFLVSVVKNEPEWDLMTCPHLEKMPAIRWKMANLDNLQKSNVRKFRMQADELLKRFEAI